MKNIQGMLNKEYNTNMNVFINSANIVILYKIAALRLKET